MWADLRAVFEPAVAALPALTGRCGLATPRRACACGHPEAADGQLKAVNDRVWLADFADKDEAAKLRTSGGPGAEEETDGSTTRTSDDPDLPTRTVLPCSTVLLGLFAADPKPILTPEPADAHPGLKAADPLDDQYPLPRNPERVAKKLTGRATGVVPRLSSKPTG